MPRGWCNDRYRYGSCNCKKARYDNDSCGFDDCNDPVQVGHCIRKVPQRQRWGHAVCAIRNEYRSRSREKSITD